MRDRLRWDPSHFRSLWLLVMPLSSPLPCPIVSSLPSVLTPVFIVPVLIRSLLFQPLVVPPSWGILPYVLLLLGGR